MEGAHELMKKLIIGFLTALFGFVSLVLGNHQETEEPNSSQIPQVEYDVPAYMGLPYAEINGNVPFFTEEDKTTERFEYYSDLDFLGRCGTTFANVCKEIMPTEERGPIGMVKPSGWHTVKYPDLIEDLYLYNRCHLIGYQLSGENANEKNLILSLKDNKCNSYISLYRLNSLEEAYVFTHRNNYKERVGYSYKGTA